MPEPRGLHRLIISAPFGNYIRPAGATPTLGTFTLLPRPGRVWRVLKTVRYSPRLKAWVNRIGLRNPGVEWLERRVAAGREDLSGSVVSIHGFDDRDWRSLVHRVAALEPLALELNMSCPNVGEIDWPLWLFVEAKKACDDHGARLIVKLPPVRYSTIFDQALDAGARTFHCCNTLPVPAGGLSGKPLKPVAQECVIDISREAFHRAVRDLTIIGGGGITSTADIDEYAALGVRHIAIGTKVMRPDYLWSDRGVRPLIRHADRVLADR